MIFADAPEHAWVVLSTGQVQDSAGQRCRRKFCNIKIQLFLKTECVTFYGIVMESCRRSFLMILTEQISQEKSYFRSAGQLAGQISDFDILCPADRKYDFS